jgi:hypothetical protein
MKRPSFQFYPGDWMSNTALRLCSLGARGLWIDMICLMHEGTPYGHLVLNGKGILPKILARRIGASLKETERLLSELTDHGVFTVTEEGVIFSPRMVRDESLREMRGAFGHKSLENPNVPRKKDKIEIPEKDTYHQPPSSSSSASAPSSPSTPSSADARRLPFLAEFEVLWAEYPKRPGANGKPRAYKEYVARRREGVPAAEILEGVRRYAAYIDATSKKGTDFIKLAANFLGPDGDYRENWSTPKPPPENVSRNRGENPPSNMLAASELIAKVRDAATIHNTYSGTRGFPPGWEANFSGLERRVLKGFGLRRILSDPNEGTLVSQVAKALGEAAVGATTGRLGK